MNNLFQLPELLTWLSYFVLCGLAIWVVAHAIHIVSEGGKVKAARVSKVCDKLERYTGKLLGKVEELKRLQAEERKLARLKSGDSREGLDSIRFRIATARAWLLEILGKIPGKDISGWLREERVDSRVVHYYCLGSEGTASVPESKDYRLSLGIPAAIATPAGAAPTMSGTMAFLRDYSTNLESGGGVLPLAGLNDALLTTWIGCFLTIVSVVLLAYTINRGNLRVGEDVTRAAAKIGCVHTAWKQAEGVAMKQMGGQRV